MSYNLLLLTMVLSTVRKAVTELKNTAAVNRKYRAVYRDRRFCCVGISGLPSGFYYRSTAVRTVTAV
jgi:hypothetical protein